MTQPHWSIEQTLPSEAIPCAPAESDTAEMLAVQPMSLAARIGDCALRVMKWTRPGRQLSAIIAIAEKTE